MQIRPGHTNDLYFFKWRRYRGGVCWREIKRPEYVEVAIPGQHATEFKRVMRGPEPVMTETGTLDWYYPFRENSDIHIEFSELGENRDKILEFATRYGLPSDLTPTNHLTGNVYNWFLSDWKNMSARFNRVITAIKENEMQLAAEHLNELAGFSANYKISIAADTKNYRPLINLEPNSLIAAMAYRLAITITEGTEYKKCTWCDNWFTIGALTGHRSTKHYCSKRCGVAAWRAGRKVKQ